jgi:large subunit ribosomal protein L10
LFTLPLTKARKDELVEEYVALIEQSKALIFTEYRGLSNAELTRLRRQVHDANGIYRVAKLTLLRKALERTGYQAPDILSGTPLGVSFCLEEVPAVAKTLADFAADSEFMKLHSGLMGAEVLNATQIKALADLPPLDVLRAQILGLLDAPAANLVGVIQAGVAQVVNVLNAYIEQGEGNEAAMAAS